MLIAVSSVFMPIGRPPAPPRADGTPASPEAGKILPREIVALLRDSEADVRAHAIARIAQFGDEEFVEELKALWLSDEVPRIRSAARQAMFSLWARADSGTPVDLKD
jgi:hypothetical protein